MRKVNGTEIRLRRTAFFTAIVALLFFSGQLEAREFTNKKGLKIEAKIVKVTGGNVVIQRNDAKKFTVKIVSLSDADQKFIADWKTENAESRFRFHFSKKRLERIKTATGTREKWAFDIDVHNQGLEDVGDLEVNYTLFKTLKDHYTKKKNIVTKVATGTASIRELKRGNQKAIVTKGVDVIRDGSTRTTRSWEGVTYYYTRWDESLTGCIITISRGGKVVAKEEFGTTVEYGGVAPKGAGTR